MSIAVGVYKSVTGVDVLKPTRLLITSRNQKPNSLNTKKGKEMIKLELTIEEINQALKHLGNGIYAEVGGLIAKIHGQALPQIQAQEPEKPAETPNE